MIARRALATVPAYRGTHRTTQKGTKQVNKTLTCTIAAALTASATFSWSPAPSTALAQGASPHEFVAPAVFQAAGPTIASITGTLDAFRAALGGINNANNAGPLAGGR